MHRGGYFKFLSCCVFKWDEIEARSELILKGVSSFVFLWFFLTAVCIYTVKLGMQFFVSEKLNQAIYTVNNLQQSIIIFLTVRLRLQF